MHFATYFHAFHMPHFTYESISVRVCVCVHWFWACEMAEKVSLQEIYLNLFIILIIST